MWSVICGLSFCCSQITSCFCQADIYINRITSFKILNWTLTGAIQWLLMNSTHLSSESKELVNFSPFGLVTDIANLVQTNGMVYHRLFFWSDAIISPLFFGKSNPSTVQQECILLQSVTKLNRVLGSNINNLQKWRSPAANGSKNMHRQRPFTKYDT